MGGELKLHQFPERKSAISAAYLYELTISAQMHSIDNRTSLTNQEMNMSHQSFNQTQRHSCLPLSNRMKGNKMKFLKSMVPVVVLLALFANLIFTNSVALAQQSKTPVCHVTGTYDFGNGPVAIGHVITIADPALPTHMAHGEDRKSVV